MHPVKEVLGDDGGNTIRPHNVPVGVLPDIAAVVQKVLYAVVGHLLAPCVLHALLVEPVTDSGHGGSLVVYFLLIAAVILSTKLFAIKHLDSPVDINELGISSFESRKAAT